MDGFADRRQAGRLLGERVATALPPGGPDGAVVLGLPRGGVPVAAQVAAVLSVPLDVLLVRKVGAPGQRELAMGAVGEDGAVTRNPEVIAHLGVTVRAFERAVRRERRTLADRAVAYRAARPALPVSGRTVIVVDDGVATGATAKVACAVLRSRGAVAVLLATPVIPRGVVAEFTGTAFADGRDAGPGSAVADRVVAVLTPETFGGVGQFYADFSATSDEEVLAILRGQIRR